MLYIIASANKRTQWQRAYLLKLFLPKYQIPTTKKNLFSLSFILLQISKLHYIKESVFYCFKEKFHDTKKRVQNLSAKRRDQAAHSTNKYSPR